MKDQHKILGGKVTLYRREGSSNWQCGAFLGGRYRRKSTKHDSLALAKDVSEDWYLGLVGKHRSGELKIGKMFTYVAEQFLAEFAAMTVGQRSGEYVATQARRVRRQLVPFFKDCSIKEITTAKVQEYRMHRALNPFTKKPTARATIHQEIVALRQLLKCAKRRGWIDQVPDVAAPYRAQAKIGHRAWLSPEDYRRLYEETRSRAQATDRGRWKGRYQDLHDYVLFMANTGLRPDEAKRLQPRDVTVTHDEATNQTILLIEVRGKRGVGYCKSTEKAVRPYQRTLARNKTPADHGLFSPTLAKLLKIVLRDLGLLIDRDGNRRSAYSLRHTYVCFRLTEGADIYQIAKNCRTSVEMIEKHYATHIKSALNAAAINVRRSRPTAPAARRIKQSRKPRTSNPHANALG